MFIHGFSRGGQLRCTSLQHALAPCPFPSLLAGAPEHFPLKCIGQILLSNPVFAKCMGVAVSLAISKRVAITMGIAQMGWHLLSGIGANVFDRFENANRAVAFLSVGQVKGRLCQGVKPFWQADAFEGRGTGLNDHNRLGVCQADVLTGGNQHSPENEAGIFSRLHHAGEPKQGSIRVRSPDRFNEGTDGVEVGITLFVVENSPLLDRLLGDGEIDDDRAV